MDPSRWMFVAFVALVILLLVVANVATHIDRRKARRLMNERWTEPGPKVRAR